MQLPFHLTNLDCFVSLPNNYFCFVFKFFFFLQWVEESFTNFEKGINWRSYVVCDVAYNNVNNWLWTPFIERGEANRIYIEIKFSMRDCSLFPGTALSCKETFSLLYYEFDAATREPPPWEPESYKLIDRIAADEGRFTSSNEVTCAVSLFSMFSLVYSPPLYSLTTTTRIETIDCCCCCCCVCVLCAHWPNGSNRQYPSASSANQ